MLAGVEKLIHVHVLRIIVLGVYKLAVVRVVGAEKQRVYVLSKLGKELPLPSTLLLDID